MGFFGDLLDDVTGRTAERAGEEAAQGRRTAARELGGVQEQFFLPAAEQQAGARNQLATFLGIGPGGVGAQQQAFQNFQNDPGFQATLDAGINTVDQGAAAGGQLNSGNRLKALFDFGQRAQSQAFQQRFANLGGFQPNAPGALFQTEQAIQGQNVGASDALAQGMINAGSNRIGTANQLASLAASLAGTAFGGGGSFGDIFNSAATGQGSGSGFGIK